MSALSHVYGRVVVTSFAPKLLADPSYAKLKKKLKEIEKIQYYAVKNMLLSVCYEIRHAFMGYRDVKKVDNGVHDEMMKWHSMKMPKTEVHFSVNLLFPEALTLIRRAL